MSRLRAPALTLGTFLLASLVSLCAGAPSMAAGSQSVSTNWAGYVALNTPASSGSAGGFSSVSGTWKQPAASCAAGSESYSAAWVGLGGYAESARALEQIGTDADCTHGGRAVYSTWFEVLPAPPVTVPLRARPGDTISASATVHGLRVTLRIRDLSTGAHFSSSRSATRVDTSSAEWIIEAPSVCPASSGCHTLQLANFGLASFWGATATAHGHTGGIGDASWSSRALELRQGAYDIVTRRGLPVRSSSRVILATPTEASTPAGAFSVSWREQPIAVEEAPRPTLPGFSGGES